MGAKQLNIVRLFVYYIISMNGRLSRLHSVDEDTVSWLTNYGLWHTYKKKKKKISIIDNYNKWINDDTKRCHSPKPKLR